MAATSGKLNWVVIPPVPSSSFSSLSANCNGSTELVKGISDLEGTASVIHVKKSISQKPPRFASEPTQEVDSLKSPKPENGHYCDGCSNKTGVVSSQKHALANNTGVVSESSLADSQEKCGGHPIDDASVVQSSTPWPLKLTDFVLGDLDDSCCEKEGVRQGKPSASNFLNNGSQCGEAKDSFVTAEASDETESAAKSSGSIKVSSPCRDHVGSGKSSICRGSTSSDVSDESSSSSFSSVANKPHKGNDSRWDAIKAIRLRDGFLGLNHFRLLKRLGCGDIGSVYLSKLSGTRDYFAMKVMDKEALASRKKLLRAQTEREILQSLDHPFLPTLYTHFETERFSCLVMEFCPGGDLHVLRQRQPGKYFPEYAARYDI